jgi:hypothetical protein
MMGRNANKYGNVGNVMFRAIGIFPSVKQTCGGKIRA